MIKRALHIVSFDIPYPPTYGGVIDVFYKIKYLSEAGIKLYCHNFQYEKRKPQPILEKYCEKVFYYKRKKFINPFLGNLPYIVKTRNDGELLTNLLQIDAPILFEGLHTCFFLNDKSLKDRKKIVRMHNIEHIYYMHLAEAEKDIVKKMYFLSESQKLKKYFNILMYADKIAAISNNDFTYLSKDYPDKTFYLPAFHPNDKIKIKEGKGNYALYTGNLSVVENIKAVTFLIKEIFNDIDYPLIIAGAFPPKSIIAMIEKYKNITLVANPSQQEMDNLLGNAHINVLPTFQPTGIKLKLLNALFASRFVIVTPDMVENTGLETLTIVVQDAHEMKNKIKEYSKLYFDSKIIEKRRLLLESEFSNKRNVKLLINELF